VRARVRAYVRAFARGSEMHEKKEHEKQRERREASRAQAVRRLTWLFIIVIPQVTAFSPPALHSFSTFSPYYILFSFYLYVFFSSSNISDD
jgi:hypothetical protein